MFNDLVRLFLQALDERGCYFEGNFACSWLPHAMVITNCMDDYALPLPFFLEMMLRIVFKNQGLWKKMNLSFGNGILQVQNLISFIPNEVHKIKHLWFPMVKLYSLHSF